MKEFWRALKSAHWLALALSITATPAQAVEWLPDGHIYPAYIANPWRIAFAAQSNYYDDSSIPTAGSRRFDLKMGGRLGAARGEDWQVTFAAGFYGQFDADNSEDNIGWDGLYALDFAQRLSPVIRYRLGIHHLSAHIGDEFVHRTGRERIEYTRQEIRAGITLDLSEHSLGYIEYGHDPLLPDKPLQRAGRTELGMQYERPDGLFSGVGSYGGFDISAYEEDSWRPNYALRLGAVVYRGDRRWRLGIELYDGRTQLGEFFQYRERYAAAGIALDL